MFQAFLKVYFYGTIASSTSIFLTISSVILLRPVLSNEQGKRILPFLVALSVGCLSGDAIFHLLPHAFHGESCDAKDGNSTAIKSTNVHHQDTIWKALPIACTIYAFYLIHLISENCLVQKFHSRSHSHLSEIVKTEVRYNDEDHDNESTDEDYKEHILKKDEKDPTHFPPVIWMIVIGDAVHFFTDGIAIGCAYAKSFYGGLGTTVAITCHEVPHCIGDFAVMVTAGLSYTKTLFILTVVLLQQFFGMILGATLSQLMDSTRAFFGISAAMFLFISLTELLPRLLNQKAEKIQRWHLPLLHSAGIFMGMAGMLAVAILEGRLHN